ncbi:MAG: thiol:disulfide interchange protein DsbA/DsbL [Pseudomonadota bacterium]
MLMRYREGTHYQKVPTAAASRRDGVEVVEFFSYGCIHCFNFDPAVEAWEGEVGGGVAFKRIPAVFNRTWEFLAQAFYTADALGVGEEMHQPLFRAIHTDNINIGDPALMAKLFKDHGGIEASDFAEAFDSFSVRSKVQQSKRLGQQMRLRAVPSMVVGGQYVVDGSMLEGGNDEMLKVVDYLVDLLETERTMLEAAAGD